MAVGITSIIDMISNGIVPILLKSSRNSLFLLTKMKIIMLIANPK